MILARRGPWRVERFTVLPDEALRRAAPALYAPPGEYLRLAHHRRGAVMSNLPQELRDHQEFVRRASGRVHISGLGLGIVLEQVLRRGRVARVEVVEIDRDVLRLIAPRFGGDPRVRFIHADALSYEPPRGAFYRAAWHDIWDSFWKPELAQARALLRAWRDRCAWQGVWGIALMRLMGGKALVDGE